MKRLKHFPVFINLFPNKNPLPTGLSWIAENLLRTKSAKRERERERQRERSAGSLNSHLLNWTRHGCSSQPRVDDEALT